MRNEEYFKDLAKRYNFLVKQINMMSKEDLIELLEKHKITYPIGLISTLTANGKLIRHDGKYTAVDEPVHYSVFRTLYEKASKTNKQSYNKRGEENPVTIYTKNDSTKVDFSVLKELIQKGVSDEVVLKLFPELKQ
jgi:hypothetical protein